MIADILLALIAAMIGVNLAATFRLLHDVGGMKETHNHLKASLERLQSRVTHLEKKGNRHELA